MAEKSLVLSGKIPPADRHPAAVYLASLPSAGSVPAQRSALNKIAEMYGADVRSMNWAALRYQHVQHIRAQLIARYAPATANRFLTALRCVLRHSWKLGYMPEDEYRKLADIESVHGSSDDTDEDLSGRSLSAGELSALMSACAEDETLAGIRDAAVIALGYGLGMRRAEVVKLSLSHYNRDRGVISIRGGKGNKSRTLPIDDGARDALEDWLRVRGDEPGAVFYGVNKGGALSSKRLNVRAVDELYLKRAAQAGIVEASHFHDLRRSFITDLLSRNVDVALVSKLAGHSDPRTTLRYDKRKMESRRKAVASLHVPYKLRRDGKGW